MKNIEKMTFAEFISGCVVPDDYAWGGNFDGISDIVWTGEYESDEGPIRFGYGVAEIDITDDDTFRITDEDIDAGTAIVNWEDVPTLVTDWQDSFDDVYCIVEVENEPTCRAVPCRRDQNFYMTKEEALAALQELLPEAEKTFHSFHDIGYDCEFFDSEGVKHLDNRFIGVVVDGEEKYTVYLDPVTGEIFPQEIYEKSEDGELTDVDPCDVEF